MPSTSQQTPLVLAVDTNWASRHGGITTFNRNLCRGLAAAGAQVYCAVREPMVREQDDARAAGVTLVHRDDEDASAPCLPNGVVPHVIIGHGRITGPMARRLRRQHYPTARLFHIIHTAPDEIEWHKAGRAGDPGMRAEERMRLEISLAAHADGVFTVGPRLRDLYVNHLAAIADAPEPVEINPGFDDPEALLRTPPPGRPREILVLGRLEDATIKGIDIAARGLAHALDRLGAQENEAGLLLRGVPVDEHKELYEQVNAWSGRRFRPVTRSFSTNAEDLRADLRRATLLPMPSRAEAYGLVAAEAIAHGTPALISERSGLAQFLRERLPAEEYRRLVVPVRDDEPADAQTWGEAIWFILNDVTAAFVRADKLRQTLAGTQTWAMAVETVLSRLRGTAMPGDFEPQQKPGSEPELSDIVCFPGGCCKSEPGFRAIALVEVEGFGTRPYPVQRQVRADLHEVVRSALTGAGFDLARLVQEDRGDGILMIDPAMNVLELAGRFVRELDHGLHEKARTSAPIARMRLRVAVHHGMCQCDGEGWFGKAVNATMRLVGSPPLKAALVAADRANLALIVSGQVFDEVIRHEYRSIDSSSFERVMIEAKEPGGEQAWIRVAGYPYPPGVTPASTIRPESEQVSAEQETESVPRRKKVQSSQSGIVFNDSTVKVRGDLVNRKIVNGGGR